MTERDKKLVLLIFPLALIIAFWFLVLSPKREESAAIQTQLETAQSEQQTAESQVASLSGAKRDFTDAYTTVVRLGKAVPANVDMPSLILQLDRAARGTDITFDKIATGERTVVTTGAAASGSGSGSADPAASGAGQTAQTAQQGVDSANATNEANAAAANGTAGSGSAAAPSSSGTLESIPLDFTFNGKFFELADFFHRMKRFVRVVNEDIVVRGRLMTIDSFTFTAEGFPHIRAEVRATVYLAPRAEGVTAGATPAGPSNTAPATSGTPSSGSSGSGGSGSGTSNPATSAPAATVK